MSRPASRRPDRQRRSCADSLSLVAVACCARLKALEASGISPGYRAEAESAGRGLGSALTVSSPEGRGHSLRPHHGSSRPCLAIPSIVGLLPVLRDQATSWRRLPCQTSRARTALLARSIRSRGRPRPRARSRSGRISAVPLPLTTGGSNSRPALRDPVVVTPGLIKAACLGVGEPWAHRATHPEGVARWGGVSPDGSRWPASV